jgi:hypothetical protein
MVRDEKIFNWAWLKNACPFNKSKMSSFFINGISSAVSEN